MSQPIANGEIGGHDGERSRLHVQQHLGVRFRDGLALGVMAGTGGHERRRHLPGHIPRNRPIVGEEQRGPEEGLEMKLDNVANPLGEAPADDVDLEIHLPRLVEQRQLARRHLKHAHDPRQVLPPFLLRGQRGGRIGVARLVVGDLSLASCMNLRQFATRLGAVGKKQKLEDTLRTNYSKNLTQRGN